MIRPVFSGREELGRRERGRHDAHEVVHRGLVALHRGDQLLQVGRRRLELREVAGELVERQRLLVALPLVAGQGVLVGPASCEAVVEGRRQQLGVAEGVADPEARDRVLVVAGVADERPAGPVRLAEEARQVARADEARLARGGVDALGELGDQVERAHEGALDVLAVGLELLLGPALHHAGQAVVRRADRPAAAVLGALVGLEPRPPGGRSSTRSRGG